MITQVQINLISPIATIELLLIIIAIAGRDYDALSAQPLNFSILSMVGDRQCVRISINDDSEPEGNETFIAEVAITMVGSEKEIMESSLITIVDNDGMLHLCN